MKLLLVGTVLALAADATAAQIRVGTFVGIASGRYGNTSSSTASTQIASILANPDSANLGPAIVVHPDGFTHNHFGTLSTSSYASATPTELSTFIEALDSLDVAIFVNNVDFGSIFSSPAHREKLVSFVHSKGVISLHRTTDTYGTWPWWDSIQGARFQNHPTSDRMATLRLDSAATQDPAWQFLNRGLPDTARFLETWLSFIANGDVIRATPGVKISVNINEASYAGGLGGARAMGADHPMSWYREFQGGGRFFYTALGSRAQHLTGTGTESSPPTHFLRRQLYNAILWTAGYNNDGTITGINKGVKGADAPPSRFADHARLSLSGGTLTVSMLHNGAHTIEILALDGRRIDSRRSAARGAHRFINLRPGVHLVAVNSPAGRSTRLVTIP